MKSNRKDRRQILGKSGEVTRHAKFHGNKNISKYVQAMKYLDDYRFDTGIIRRFEPLGHIGTFHFVFVLMYL